jgi:hypothetical protein
MLVALGPIGLCLALMVFMPSIWTTCLPPTEGAIAGLATITKGIGLLTGPLLTGAAIDILSPYLDDTNGYQAL